MEIVNIVDRSGKYLKGVKRGSKLEAGEYNSVVHIWVYNNEGEFLIQKRSATCLWKPNVWATHGGLSLEHEKTHETAKRELFEEMGLDYQLSHFERVFRVTHDNFNLLGDVFFVKYDNEEIKIDNDEVSAYDFLNFDDIIELVLDEKFISYYSDDKELNKDYWEKIKLFLERSVGNGGKNF